LEDDFRPLVSDDQRPRELTVFSAIFGVVLAVVFAGANAYLALRIGATISSSIPSAVMSMAIMRLILKRVSILENNMAQPISSAGESMAGGAIFTLPALFFGIWSGARATPTVG
jgi:putative OPT family oligopeptide transporter